MTDDKLLPFSFPSVARKKVTADFDGGRLTSDGGVMLLSMAERRLGVAERLARCFPDRRDPARITHSLADMIRARIFAISCGYEDADDLDFLRADPAFKLACGRLPDTGRDLCSQPTLSRLENAPSLKDAIRLTYALVDQWMDSYDREPASVTLDIDDTCDVVHGHQQLSLFNAHYDERCFLPIHVYDTDRSRPVAVVLRPGKTPSGVEVRAHLRRLTRHIRKRWPKTRILFRGDGHYARPEAMAWCEDHGVDYVFGLPGTKPLSKKVDETADAVRTERAIDDKDVTRGYAETRHRAKSWDRERRAIARVEATRLGLDIRFVVTNLPARLGGAALRQSLLRARSGREPDQVAQIAACLGSHVVPVANRQPSAPRPAHWRLLADARCPRRHSHDARPGEGRVRHFASAPDQDRRTRHRDSQPGASRLRRRLSRSRPVPGSPRSARAAEPVNAGHLPRPPIPSPPARSKKSWPERRQKGRTILRASDHKAPEARKIRACGE